MQLTINKMKPKIKKKITIISEFIEFQLKWKFISSFTITAHDTIFI